MARTDVRASEKTFAGMTLQKKLAYFKKKSYLCSPIFEKSIEQWQKKLKKHGFK